jgi:hypothetical protein
MSLLILNFVSSAIALPTLLGHIVRCCLLLCSTLYPWGFRLLDMKSNNIYSPLAKRFEMCTQWFRTQHTSQELIEFFFFLWFSCLNFSFALNSIRHSSMFNIIRNVTLHIFLIDFINLSEKMEVNKGNHILLFWITLLFSVSKLCLLQHCKLKTC